MKKGVLVILALMGLATACNVEPSPIQYGSDECSFCSMMIMDERFGAELVNEKGKIYKFDSGECMIRYKLKNDDTEFAHVMVTHFQEPKQLQDAQSSYFVVSENIPSPMGGNLSAYPSEELANAAVNENNGEVYSWLEILDSFQSR